MTSIALSYARERLLTPPVVGASVLLALATLPRGVPDVVPAIATAYLLVAQFRIFDDVADRGVDAQRAPNRVLVRGGSIVPIVGLAGLCAVVTVALLLRTPAPASALAGYGLLAGGLLVYYRRRHGRSAFSIAVLLLKYPGIAVVLAAAMRTGPRPAAVAMVVAYAAACAFEYLHDRGDGAFSGRDVLLLQAMSLVATFVVLRTF